MFQALRATHAENWLGYLDSSGTMLKGIEHYMDWNQVDPKSPYGMKSYKFREFDMISKVTLPLSALWPTSNRIGPAGRRIARCKSAISTRRIRGTGFKAEVTLGPIKRRWRSSWLRRDQLTMNEKAFTRCARSCVACMVRWRPRGFGKTDPARNNRNRIRR
jgi:hypothetical protein